MIDFKNMKFIKLRQVDNSAYLNSVSSMLVANEKVILTFKGIRDGMVFTNKRIFAINVQGISGMKKAFTTLPYDKIQAFSLESAGIIDWDSEMELWFSGIGKLKFEFKRDVDVSNICRIISEQVLKTEISV